MTAPYVIHYAGSTWGLINYHKRDASVTCFMCGKLIRRGIQFYRCRTWGSSHTDLTHSHQKCLIGQIDPTIWDIP